MGAVYKARQVSLKRFVALKTLQTSLASDPEYIARFHREAIAAASLNHPNLVQVHAAGENEGLHWFAMEYVEGESAQARLKRKGRLDPAASIAIGIHVATALDYAWRKAQLIHRDIKPDNIFLSSDGEVKLGDLGLAKSTGEDQSLTTTGASMGTPHYVSPEQGEGKKDVDLRADIYSLGCTLFHFIAGETPFKGDTAMAVMLRHVTAPVPELRSVWPGCPEELSRVVMKMMQKQPAARPQTYAEVIADLRGAYDAFTSGTVPALLTVSRQSPNAAGKRLPAAALAIGIALIAAAAALLHFAPWKKGGANSAGTSVPPHAGSKQANRAAYFAGTWQSDTGSNFFLREDFTATRTMAREDKPFGGRWTVDGDGQFEFTSTEGKDWSGRFTSDGQTLHKPRTPYKFSRVKPEPAKTVVAAVPSPVKPDPAKLAGYAGTWVGPVGKKFFDIREDHTALKTDGDGDKVKGTWEMLDEECHIKWDDHTRFIGKLSEDGQTLNAKGGAGAGWSRKKP